MLPPARARAALEPAAPGARRPPTARARPGRPHGVLGPPLRVHYPRARPGALRRPARIAGQRKV